MKIITAAIVMAAWLASLLLLGRFMLGKPKSLGFLVFGVANLIAMRLITLYRDDSTVQVVFDRVKSVFWTAGNTVLVVSQYTGECLEHRYIHWPRERFCWFKDEPEVKL